MKTVGKQLQEARLARNWTPELAARETKIKVDRLHDLEADDYSHFTSPTYARGFVRTYARSLGLDEYQILRQLDNKLPDDDSANIATEGGVAYLPETAMPPRAAHRDYTGLYIVMALGAVVTLAIAFVLFEAYRVGELSRWFASSPEPAAGTNAAPANPATGTTARALPVDSNTPPPIPVPVNDQTASTNTASATPPAPAEAIPGLTSPKALPVDPSILGAAPAAATNSAPAPEAPAHALRALPVDPSELTNAPPANSVPATTEKAPPRALPVNPSELGAPSTAAPVAQAATTTVALNNPPPPSQSMDPAQTTQPVPPKPSSSARQSNSNPVMETSPPPAAPTPESTPAAAQTGADSAKPLILTASQDSFVRVTTLDSPDTDKPLYADVLRSGQSIGFSGHKFSINVGVPSAVDIKLDGVNYGPHSDRESPETFTVQSQQQ